MSAILDSTIHSFETFLFPKEFWKNFFLKFWFYFSVRINVLKCVCLHDHYLTTQAFVPWHFCLWYFSPRLFAAKRLLHLVGATEQCTMQGFGMTERHFGKKKDCEKQCGKGEAVEDINFSRVHVVIRNLENDPVNYPCSLETRWNSPGLWLSWLQGH